MTHQPRYSIVVVTYNSSADIVRCLDSVKAHTADYEIVVVDNASSDTTAQILCSYPGIKTILNSSNMGFTAATNQGIRATSGKFVIFLNPDTEVFPLWADRMADKMESVKGVGGVGPMSTNCLSYQSVYSEHPEWSPLPISEIAERVIENGGEFRDVPILIGFCFMTSRDVLVHVGLLDERLFLGNDDLEFSWRLRLNGYRLVVARDAFIAHEMQKSFNTVPKETTRKLVQQSTDELYRKLVRRYGRAQLPDPVSLWSIQWFTPSEEAKKEVVHGPETRLRLVISFGNGATQFEKEWLKELSRFFDVSLYEKGVNFQNHDIFLWFENGTLEPEFNPFEISIPTIAVLSGKVNYSEQYSNLSAAFDFALVSDYRLYASLREKGIENIDYFTMASFSGIAALPAGTNFDISCLECSEDGGAAKALASISGKRQVFLGRVDEPDEYRSLIASSAIIVKADYVNEGFTAKEMEVLGMGKLLFAPELDDGCPIHTIVAGQHYVSYSSTDELLQKVEYYLEHKNEAERIGEAAKIAVSGRYAYQANAFRLGAVLREALSLVRGGRCGRNNNASWVANVDKKSLEGFLLYITGLLQKEKRDYQTAKRCFGFVAENKWSSNDIEIYVTPLAQNLASILLKPHTTIQDEYSFVCEDKTISSFRKDRILDNLINGSCLNISEIFFIENNISQSEKYLEKLIETNADNKVFLLSAKLAAANGNFEVAAKKLLIVERKKRLSLTDWIELCKLYMQLGRQSEAESALVRGVNDLQIISRMKLASVSLLEKAAAKCRELTKQLGFICEELDGGYLSLKNNDGEWMAFTNYVSCPGKTTEVEIDLNTIVGVEERLREIYKEGKGVLLKFRNAQSLDFIEQLSEGKYNGYLPMAGYVNAEYTLSTVENILSRCGFECAELDFSPVSTKYVTQKEMEHVRAGRILLKRIEFTDNEWNRFFMESCSLRARPRVYKDVSKLKVSIVILTFNQVEYTMKCLESIHNNTDAGSFELIVVDNASKDGSVEWLKKEKAAGRIDKLILNSDNKGVSAGWNQGMRVSSGDYILIFNNDTIVPRNWLRNMLRCAESANDIGMVGPMSNSISGLQCEKECGYTSMHELMEFAAKYMKEREGNWWELFRIVGFCMLIKKKVVDEIGEFDERFGKGNFEDDDYCLRLRRAGYRLMVAGDSFIHHFGGVSFAQAGVDWREQMHKNELLFREKWEKLDAELMAGRAGNDLNRTMEEAEKHIASCDYPAAIHLLLMLLEKDPKNARAYNNMGVVAWQKGNAVDGEQFFKEALKHKPDFEDAVLNLSDAYRLRGDIENDLELLGKSVKLLPASSDIKKRIEESAHKSSVEQKEKIPSDILLSEADSLMELGAHKEAEIRYGMVAEKEPDNGAALNGLGICAWYDGNHENAYWFFRKAVESLPTDEDTLINFTDAALVTGRSDEAEKILTRALSLKPGLKEVGRMVLDIKASNRTAEVDYGAIISARELNLQGEKLISEGLIDKAEEKFREILNYLPNHFVAINNMALCDWYRGDVEKAFGGFKKSLAESPAYEDALINLFDAALKLHKVDEAVPFLEKAVSINPLLRDAGDILNQIRLRGNSIYDLKFFGQIGRGSELNEEGRKFLDELKFAEATAKFIEHIEKHGDNCESYCGLGIVQYYRQEYEDAYRLFSHAVELNPLSEDALLNLFDASIKTGLVDQTISILKNAIDIDPTLTKVQQVLSERI